MPGVDNNNAQPSPRALPRPAQSIVVQQWSTYLLTQAIVGDCNRGPCGKAFGDCLSLLESGFFPETDTDLLATPSSARAPSGSSAARSVSRCDCRSMTLPQHDFRVGLPLRACWLVEGGGRRQPRFNCGYGQIDHATPSGPVSSPGTSEAGGYEVGVAHMRERETYPPPIHTPLILSGPNPPHV